MKVKKPQTRIFTCESWEKKLSAPQMVKLMEAAIAYDFMEEVEVKENGIFLRKKRKDGNGWCKEPERLILSPSSMNYQASRSKIAVIPEFLLEHRRLIGTNLMLNLETLFKQKCRPEELDINDQDYKLVKGMYDFLVRNKIKVKAVEKFVHNKQIGGFIDMIVDWGGIPCIFEIKARTRPELRKTDYIQACAYKSLLWNMTTYVITIDNDGVVSAFPIIRRQSKAFGSLFDDTLKHFMKFDIIDQAAALPVPQIDIKETLNENPFEEKTNQEN